ncbi:PAS domain S-box protein [Myxococcota bacterium]|nr:PAS domain S-box protein [Myxococcota bacterium]MBU1380476.1 PAS domain S-box protein [Myxococcota bacterium]MBU1498192.1 PAS domain S-box protein [Myxococcota bacterium]
MNSTDFDVLKNFPDPAVVMDATFRVVFMNQTAEKLFRVKAINYLGQSIDTLIEITDGMRTGGEIRLSIIHSGFWKGERPYEAPTGFEGRLQFSVSKYETDGDERYVVITRESDQLQRKLSADASPLTQLAIDLAEIPSGNSLSSYLVKWLKKHTGAFAATFSEYNYDQKILRLRDIEIDPGWLEKIVGLLGRRLEDINYPVSDEIYNRITNQIAGRHYNLYEASFGEIPKLVGASIQKITGIDYIIGIAFVIEGRLYGTSLLAMKKGQPAPTLEFLGTFANIAAVSLRRKYAEDVLRSSEERLQSIFRVAPTGIGLVRDRVFVDINERICEMTGYTAEELIGKSSRMIYPTQEDFDYVKREKYGQIKEKGTGEVETRWMRKDGTIINILLASTPLNPLDLSRGVTFTALDITKRKRAEEEKERLQSQLQQAMKMEAVGRLAGGVAHDFNNLLTAISGNVQLALLDLPPGHFAEESLNDIAKAAQSAASLTGQLLAFSRKQLIEPKVLNLNTLIVSLEKMLRRFIGEDIELETIHGKNLKTVKIDPGQFEQILMNLAVNARDAMPGGGRLIIETMNKELDTEYCSIHPDAEPGEYVMLAVSDNGSGMDAETKSHLFEPFFTTKPKGRGTGLGLATIYGAIRQAGGFVEVYSEVGKGTAFKIYIPVVSDEPEYSVAATPPLDMIGGTETVFIVEDEKNVREMAIRILSRLGYKILEAPSGKDALILAENYKDNIDLLLTDVIMPGINGRELAVRMLPIHPEMKVLYTSGYTENAIAHHGVIDAGLHFIGKPYTPQSLAIKLRQVLSSDAPVSV